MFSRVKTSVGIGAILVIVACNAASSPAYSRRASSWDCNEDVLRSALSEISRKDYEQGRLKLKKLVGRKCSFASAAILLIADSYYREGGSSGLANAEEGYALWLKLFPQKELAPPVMKKIAELHLRQLNGRDGNNHLALARQTLMKLRESYPELADDPNVQEYLLVTQELVANHELSVARFYLENRESATATKMRCLVILEKFPEYSKMDAALWYLAQAEERLAAEESEDNINNAIASYQRIAREHSDSEYRERAVERLRYFGRDTPEPDSELSVNRRERASKVKPILADIDGYLMGISRRGVLINEMDEIEGDGLNRILKDE